MTDRVRANALFAVLAGLLPIVTGSAATVSYYAAVVAGIGLIGWGIVPLHWEAFFRLPFVACTGLFAVVAGSVVLAPNPPLGLQAVSNLLHLPVFMVLVIVLVHVPRVRLLDFMALGVRAGAILALPVALYQVNSLGMRAEGAMGNAIVYGTTSALFAALSLHGFDDLRGRQRIIAILGAMCGSCGAILSGSQVSWVALIAFAAFFLFHQRFFARRGAVSNGAIGALVVVGALATALAIGPYANRFQESLLAVNSAMNDKNYQTSFGHRLLLWQTGWQIFKENPLTGIGPQNLMGEVNRRVKAAGHELPEYTHLHNGFLHTAAGSGILAPFFVLLVVLMPLAATLRSPRERRFSRRVYAGLCLSSGYFLFGLTGIIFGHDLTNTVFFSCAAVIVADASNARRLAGIDSEETLAKAATGVKGILPAMFSRRSLVMMSDMAAVIMAIVLLKLIGATHSATQTPLDLILFAVMVPTAFAVNFYNGLYASNWRFASIPDLFNILTSATVITIIGLLFDMLMSNAAHPTIWFDPLTTFLFWVLLNFFLSGPRILYRFYRHWRFLAVRNSDRGKPVLLIGTIQDAVVFLHAREMNNDRNAQIIGILSPLAADQGQQVQNVRVLGALPSLDPILADIAQSRDEVPDVILLAGAFKNGVDVGAVMISARRHGAVVSQGGYLSADADLTSFTRHLNPLQSADLFLQRHQAVSTDLGSLRFAGLAAVVTGGGGSIGFELCRKLIASGISRLLVLEISEPALHRVNEAFGALGGGVTVEGRIVDVRDRRKVLEVCQAFQPDLVFHAAALKHVPILERDWDEAIRSNTIGTVNVADAAVAVKAQAMVLISTDKAINPTSVLGKTKRMAELYCQALDADLRAQRAAASTRLVAVRFGNVLASSGSVFEVFREQIARGGPVTVTDPNMTRYFMHTSEACSLVLTASRHAIDHHDLDSAIYVLDMGEPIKIIDLAETMIRLAGFSPGKEIEIRVTGIRPGERLHEFACHGDIDLGKEGFSAASEAGEPLETIRSAIASLEQAVDARDKAVAMAVLRQHTAPTSQPG